MVNKELTRDNDFVAFAYSMKRTNPETENAHLMREVMIEARQRLLRRFHARFPKSALRFRALEGTSNAFLPAIRQDRFLDAPIPIPSFAINIERLTPVLNQILRKDLNLDSSIKLSVTGDIFYIQTSTMFDTEFYEQLNAIERAVKHRERRSI